MRRLALQAPIAVIGVAGNNPPRLGKAAQGVLMQTPRWKAIPPAVALALMLLGSLRPSGAAMLPTDLLKLAQQSTYEVVLPKVEPDYVRYEKPLPLELLSFRDRNDKFWSIGTAFAIAPDTFVSAAHVFLSGMDSAFGKPQLRDAQGHTYLVEQVLKFSLHQDFIVFRARGVPASQVLAPNRSPATGTSVYAVGNALGDGVVLRDGLLTSMTPEDQDGRWKWLRFSAAASPGNSGGPLLDADGRVLGIVTAKSPGENLNYALPIALVLDAGGSATMDVRSSFGVPILRQQLVTEFKDEFRLPLSWDEFARTLVDRGNRQLDANQRRLLAEHAASLPPGGSSARLLAKVDRDVLFGLIHQQDDDTWGISDPEQQQETRLTDGGTLWMGSVPGAMSFRMERPGDSAGLVKYRDDRAFMDTLLKGIKLPRSIGAQAIRITSLGNPREQSLHRDRFGRAWQVRSWSLGFADLELVTFSLPTPEGFSGFLQVTQAAQRHESMVGLRLLADYAHVIYRGSPAQWNNLLADAELCPAFLRGVKFAEGGTTTVALHDLDLSVPASVMKIGTSSRLTVLTRYAGQGGALRAELGGITIETVPEDNASWLGIWAQPHPAEDAGRELNERWRRMSTRDATFNGQPQRSSDFTSFWSTSVVGDPAVGLLYEVSLNLFDKSLLPRQVTEQRDALLAALKVNMEGPAK
jgi:hypothetical protein